MDDQKRDRNICGDDSWNKENLVINRSEKEIRNNMSGDLASKNNNNTISFNFNTNLELDPGPVPEQMIQSLNGFSSFPIVFDPKIPPPNFGLITMQKYPGQSVTGGQCAMQNAAVGQKESMNTIQYRNQCDSNELAQTETDPTNALQRQANNSMMIGDYEGALKDSQMVIALDNKSKDGYNCIIKCCLALGDLDGAQQAVKKFIEIGGNEDICTRYADRCERLRSSLVMATKCFEEQDFQASVQYVDIAREIAPACLKCKLLKARCLIHLGLIDNANAIATSCKKSKTSSNPNAPSVITMAGLSACSKGDLNGGLTYFQQAAELDLDQIKACIMEIKTKKPDMDLFEVKISQEPYIKAPVKVNEITEVFDIEPPNDSFDVQLHNNRAFVNAKKGNFLKAISDCTCALNISPNHLKALLLRAKCHNEVGNYEGCFRDYEAAFEIEKTSEIEQALEKAKIEWKNSADDKFNAGNHHFKIKNYSSALQFYNEAINLSPLNSDYYCYRSECLMIMGDYNGALRDCKKAISLDEKSVKGLECIMKCSVCLGDVNGTEEASKRLIEIDPNNEIRKQCDDKCKQLRTLIDMATQCFEKKDFHAAVGHVESALQIATACLKLRLMKAECLVYIGHIDAGIAIAVLCLEIDPSNVNAFYVVGLCSYYRGDLNDGLSFFQKALDLDSNHEQSKMMLLKAKDLKDKKENGEKMFEADKFGVAQKKFSQALEIDSLNININSMLYVNRAKCHKEMKDFKKCVEDFRAALKLNKTREIEQALKEANIALNRQAKFKKNTGDRLFRSKNYSAALPFYNKSIELSPKNAFYLNCRSECLMMMGDYKEALRDSQSAVALDKKSKNALERITKCCLMIGDIDGVEIAIKNLIEIYPNNENCKQYQEQCKQFRSLVDMAVQYYEKDNFQKSVYQLNCALKIAPACVKVKILKAENLLHLGRANEANHIVTAFLETDPSNADVLYVAGLYSCYKSDLDQGLTYFQRALDIESGHNKAQTMQLKAKNLKQKKENGDILFKASQFRDAHKMYTEAIQIDPLNSNFNAKLYFNRALMSSKMGNTLSAIADCSKALDLSSCYLKALLLRGKCHNNINNFTEGIKDFESALKISNTTEIENSLKEAKAALKRQADNKKDAGNQQFRSGNYSSAIDLYEEAIKLCPSEAIYHRNKSTCLIKMGNYTDALKEGRAALGLDEKSEKGYECILKCYLALGDIFSAEAAIKKLKEIDSNQKFYKPYENQLNNLRTSAEKALQTFERKDFKAAVQHIESALKVAIACMKYKIMKAECLLNIGRLDEANDIAVLCMLIDPMNSDTVYVSGLCSYYKGDLGSGLTYFQKALALDPDHIKARIMRTKVKNMKMNKDEGDYLFRTGQYREARDVYTETLKIDASNVNFNAKLHFNRALISSKLGLVRDAIAECTKALKMTPNYVKAYLLRAKCHNEMENYEECAQDYESSLKIEKSSETERLLNEVTTKMKNLADNKKSTGDEQYNAGRYSMALNLFNQACKLFPKCAGYYCDKAKCLFAMLNYKDALKESLHAVRLDGKSPDGHDYIMKCSLITGEVSVAERTMDKLIAFDPNNIIYKRHETKYTKLKTSAKMANQCFEKKDFQAAIRYIDDALEIATACTEFKLLKAECLIYLGRYDEANNIATLCKLLITDPLSAEAVYLSGLSSYYKDDLVNGLKNFEQALKMDPDHKKAQTMRLNAKNLKEKKDQGDRLFRAGKFKEACEKYTEALKVNKMSKDFKSKLLFNRALMDSKLGNFLNSIDDCTEALVLNPKYLKVILLRAKCYSEMENYRDCINDYENVITNHYNLLCSLERSSEIEQALKEAIIALGKQSEKKDYYKILNIAQNATDDEIKKAYRKQALLHHPDKHAGASRETMYRQEMKFKTIGEANAVLSDPERRRQFDYSLRKSSF